MEIEGFTEDQIAALAEIWDLGAPIDVGRFLRREDIPEAVKERVIAEGRALASSPLATNRAQTEAYRCMQAQVLIEVARLDKQRWNPTAQAGQE